MFERCNSGFGKFSLIGAIAVITTSLVGVSKPVQGSRSNEPPSDEYRITVNVGLVVLPVKVTDRKGTEVSGLKEDSFHVFEDGRPQQIALFEPEDVPVTVGLVVDTSGSMGSKRPQVVSAATDFANLSNPQDQMFVVNFNDNISFGLPKDVPFTGDVHALESAITRTSPSGNTALYDGVAAALGHLKTGTGTRKALMVISDGGDNASHISFAQLLKRAEASNAQINVIGVFDENYSDESPYVLKRLAKATGGKAYFPQSSSQIPEICQQIAGDLRHQYTIGYRSNSANPGGKYHAIRVTATNAGAGKLRVHTRTGYLAPEEPASAPPAAKASL